MPSPTITTDQNPSQEEIYGLKKAIQTAWTELSEQPTEDIIKRTMCIMGETSNSLILPFLNKQYSININAQTVETEDGEQFYNLFLIGIMLHYLTHAQDSPLANKYMSFRELWGGQEYYYAFNNRVLVPLVETFGHKSEQFVQAAEVMDGEKIEKGEYGFKIPGLPRVPVYILLWTGDDEVEASGNVLFDATANKHMETEALVWLAVATVSELKKCLR
jgi:hypothetical protein